MGFVCLSSSRVLCQMFPVSLDLLSLIALSVPIPRFLMGSVLLIVFSFQCCVLVLFAFVMCFLPNVACVYVLSIFDCPFGFL